MGATPDLLRLATVRVDVGAIAHNVGVLLGAAAPSDLWAVVKADGYGHGAIRVARAALDAGAAGLCVAFVQEALELRDAGITAPILVLTEQPDALAAQIVEARLMPTVSTVGSAAALAGAAAKRGDPLDVHVNIDTGMQRVGVAPSAAVGLVRCIVGHAPALRLHGVFTHLACADDPTAEANRSQLDRFDTVLSELAAAGFEPPVVHAANSAGVLAHPRAHRSLVRAGIAIYGISPGPGVDHLCGELRPALSLRTSVSFVKRVAAGSHVSYGWRHRFERETNVATLPIGYADGVPRRLGTRPDRPGFDVLIGGRRCPIVGVVTMDQCMVDVGDDDAGRAVAAGDEAVLIGRQGAEQIRVEDWAEHLDTIGYEVVCGISARVPRVVPPTAESP